MKVAPAGKWLLIGSEDIEVWPNHCVDGHRCIQCFFTGKYGCAPRFWYYPCPELLEEPPQPRSSYYSLSSLESVFIKKQIGQPLDPIPDGGFTEEITEALMARRFFRREEPYRVIDHDCEGCGYPYLTIRSTNKDSFKERYQCPRCGRSYIKDKKEGIPERARIYLGELREQGFTYRETNERIYKIFKIRMSKKTYGRIIKEMGLPPRKSGWFGDKERHIATRLGKGTPEKAKLYLKELREQGVSFKETKERIYKRMKVRMSWATYWRIVKELGLPPLKSGRLGKVKVCSPV